MAATTVQTHDWRAQAANQTRLAFGQALLEVAARAPKTVVLSADTQDLLGIRPYMARYPERFVEVGRVQSIS
jgi:transketolase C-terminal domain/subunit